MTSINKEITHDWNLFQIRFLALNQILELMKTLEDSFESKDSKEIEKEEKDCNEETHALLNCVSSTVRFYLLLNIIEQIKYN